MVTFLGESRSGQASKTGGGSGHFMHTQKALLQLWLAAPQSFSHSTQYKSHNLAEKVVAGPFTDPCSRVREHQVQLPTKSQLFHCRRVCRRPLPSPLHAPPLPPPPPPAKRHDRVIGVLVETSGSDADRVRSQSLAEGVVVPTHEVQVFHQSYDLSPVTHYVPYITMRTTTT